MHTYWAWDKVQISHQITNENQKRKDHLDLPIALKYIDFEITTTPDEDENTTLLDKKPHQTTFRPHSTISNQKTDLTVRICSRIGVLWWRLQCIKTDISHATRSYMPNMDRKREKRKKLVKYGCHLPRNAAQNFYVPYLFLSRLTLIPR